MYVCSSSVCIYVLYMIIIICMYICVFPLYVWFSWPLLSPLEPSWPPLEPLLTPWCHLWLHLSSHSTGWNSMHPTPHLLLHACGWSRSSISFVFVEGSNPQNFFLLIPRIVYQVPLSMSVCFLSKVRWLHLCKNLNFLQIQPYYLVWVRLMFYYSEPCCCKPY